ncbi:hypothetical protein CWR41_04615 [Cedecea lapagei]|nr:hypothetical protein CWR41_04615 [Cedecea lapagei]
MNNHVDLNRFKYELALKKWQADCRKRMAQRYPTIAFDADHWLLKGVIATNSRDFSFIPALRAFADKHPSYSKVLRCLVAETVLGEKIRDIRDYVRRLRVIQLAPSDSMFDLDYADLHSIETTALHRARKKPSTAQRTLVSLSQLDKILDTIATKGVIPRLRYRMKSETRQELNSLRKYYVTQSRQAKTAALDRMIEALNEAFNALFANDPRLSSGDRVAIATMGLGLCAPSRINEILCMSVDDYVSVDDYAQRIADKEVDTVHAAHQMLLITMKGSKGAQWSAKPVLNFMIELFHYCLKVILDHGKRSRMLVEWYQHHPNQLYLPPELEHLRYTNLTARSLSYIMGISVQDGDSSQHMAKHLMTRSGVKRFKVPNPDPITKCGTSPTMSEVDAIRWDDIEPILLNKVHTALENCRIVTAVNHYTGDLAKMLFLFDHDASHYMPGAIKYDFLKRRLKQTTAERQYVKQPTLFEKLRITMPIDGVTQIAEINTHDPRRWLTTMALTYGEKLSNVLINKWANRLSVAQLWHYDFRSAETNAAAGALPVPHELTELSKGLISCRKLEDKYGPRIDIVTVHDAGISGTTLDAISAAIEDRPIARTGEQIIIIYPTWYGFCSHQHHEKPCRAYTSCLPCNNNHLVKGHPPTNDRTRVRSIELHSAILNIVEQTIIIYNREIADDQNTLAQHVSHLVERGLTPTEMTDELIARFHEIKNLVKDIVLKNMLHEAFVAAGYVEKLDNPMYMNGALMKYHNPTHHAAPGVERALDAHGGHEQIGLERLAMIEKYPQFAPTKRGLKDQQHLNEPDDDNNQHDGSEDTDYE